MIQSHLVIDFPIEGPANAEALREELPPLMSDLAKAQDDLGTVHFSRFMVRGDEKLLFLSDIDGEATPHVEWLVEGAGAVLDAVFRHVDDPPATPVGNNREKVLKWLKNHIREPLDTYFAYEDASVQDIKECRACCGLHGQYLAGTLADLHGRRVTCASLCLEAGRAAHDREEGTRSIRLYRHSALLPLGAL